MIYFTTEYNGNADQLILKPLHCEVHTQEVEILLLNIAQCLWKDVFSQRGICGKGPLQKTCSVGKWRKEKEKWKKVWLLKTCNGGRWEKEGDFARRDKSRRARGGVGSTCHWETVWILLKWRLLSNWKILKQRVLTSSKKNTHMLLFQGRRHQDGLKIQSLVHNFTLTHNCYLLWGQHSGQGWREEADWGYLGLPLQHLQRDPPPCTGTSPSPSRLTSDLTIFFNPKLTLYFASTLFLSI